MTCDWAKSSFLKPENSQEEAKWSSFLSDYLNYNMLKDYDAPQLQKYTAYPSIKSLFK